jgi:D-alanyl-D-alanine carboxypeptidase
MTEIEERIQQEMESDENDLALIDGERYTSTVPVVPQLSVALGLLIFVFSITYVGASKTFTTKDRENVTVEAALAKNNIRAVSPATVFDDVTIRAKSAFVWDVQTQRVLFNKNADEVRPIASITKLMTALVAYELLDPEDTVSITPNSLSVEGDSGFVDGEKFTVQDLADITLISSSNDGATALSREAGKVFGGDADPEALFVRAMNIKAEELGLSKTSFSNSTGLDVSPTEAGAHSSARDVALLMEYMITNITDAVALTNLNAKAIQSKNGESHIAKNTNDVVSSIDGLIASKTGYTELSGGNLVVAVNAGLNRPIIIVVLGSSHDERFSDTLALLERTHLYIEKSGE